MTTFVNSEINKMLKKEKPANIVVPKYIVNKKMSNKLSKYTKEKLTRSFEGYIRKRLKQKCDLNGIKIIEVNPVDISVTCSKYGEIGKKQNSEFICEKCGLNINKNINSAINIEKRYLKID